MRSDADIQHIQHRVPVSWLSAIVTPVTKVPQPQQLSDFRPILVTPIISRVAEKLIVTRWLRPAIPREDIVDQFAVMGTFNYSS